MILGLGGSKGSGKTTIAESIALKSGYMTNDSVIRLAFGDNLKRMLSTVFNLNIDLFYNEQHKEADCIDVELNQNNIRALLDYANDKLVNLNPLQYRSGMGFEYPRITSPRRLMQVIGTELFRTRIDPHYWVKCFNLLSIKGIDNRTIVLIDDVRFQNEIDYIKANNGKLVYIERNLSNNDTHVSENSNVVKLGSDIVIINDDINTAISNVLGVL